MKKCKLCKSRNIYTTLKAVVCRKCGHRKLRRKEYVSDYQLAVERAEHYHG